MELFDLSIEKYVFKWEGKIHGGVDQFIAEVQNESGKKIGAIQRIGQGLFKKDKIVLTNTENSILLNVYSKGVFAGFNGLITNRITKLGKYQVNDFDENMLGNMISPSHGYLIMNTNGGDLTFHNIGPKLNESIKSDLEYQINSTKGNIATFTVNTDVTGSWGRRNYINTCILQIHDLKFERKNIIGMFICCMLIILDGLDFDYGRGD